MPTKTTTKKSTFDVLNAINVNDRTEKKGQLTYLSWSWAWQEVKKTFPDATYSFRVHYNAAPALLESDGTNYISMNFPNGLLYCCLSEAYGFLKGPIDMLTLYENKYKQEVQKFANEQVGRRRRDDYTDGAVRIPVTSANP